jgi:hypothetical protein
MVLGKNLLPEFFQIQFLEKGKGTNGNCFPVKKKFNKLKNKAPTQTTIRIFPALTTSAPLFCLKFCPDWKQYIKNTVFLTEEYGLYLISGIQEFIGLILNLSEFFTISILL